LLLGVVILHRVKIFSKPRGQYWCCQQWGRSTKLSWEKILQINHFWHRLAQNGWAFFLQKVCSEISNFEEKIPFYVRWSVSNRIM